MMIHDAPFFRIYWGNATDGIFPDIYKGGITKPLLEHPRFAPLKRLLAVDDLIFLNQVHGISGAAIEKHASLISFTKEGDYLVTDEPGIALGVMTADCLPVVIFDSRTAAVAIVHAGWRGATQKILAHVLAAMHKRYGTKNEYLKIFFGPCARVCCYEVAQDFKTNLDNCTYSDEVLITRGKNLYFDLPAFNRLQLEELGIKVGAIQDQYNKCTICNEGFFSYRRQGKNAGRQMTVVCVK